VSELILFIILIIVVIELTAVLVILLVKRGKGTFQERASYGDSPLVVINMSSPSSAPPYVSSPQGENPSPRPDKDTLKEEPPLENTENEAPQNPETPPPPEPPQPMYSEPALKKEPEDIAQQPPENPNITKCPECGKENSIFRDKCFNCNTPL